MYAGFIGGVVAAKETVSGVRDPGSSSDLPQILQTLDKFILPEN